MSNYDVAAVVCDLKARNLLDMVLDICNRRGVLVPELCGRSHRQSIVRARHEVWARLRSDPEHHFSFPDIARLFHRDHSTVIAGVRAHTKR